MRLQNINSVAGFERRLNDISCGGCHQTRGIGGFHFPGVDWMAANPSNTIVVPASPHFFGDQVRRRDIVTAFRDGKEPDFSHGFASRPQLRGSTELAGTQYEDGWGAHCYAQSSNAGGERQELQLLELRRRVVLPGAERGDADGDVLHQDPMKTGSAAQIDSRLTNRVSSPQTSICGMETWTRSSSSAPASAA